MKLSLYKTLLVYVVFSISSLQSSWSQNLVPNHSFETRSTCPAGAGEIERATGWHGPSGHSGTPDYYSRCAVHTEQGVPHNIAGHQQPKSGNAYAGIFTYYKDIKEYLQIRLLESLSPGKTYKVSFYVSAADRGVVGTDRVGLHFSQEALRGTGTFDPLPYAPHIRNAPGRPITDTLGWTLITGNYRAVGGESYLTIGNFFYDADSPVKLYNPNGQILGTDQVAGYIYIDDVSVEETVPAITVVGDTIICAGEQATLFASGAISFKWFAATDPSKKIASTPTLQVSPGKTTTYLVEGDNVSTIVTVQVIPRPDFTLGKDTTLCDGQLLRLMPRLDGAAYRWQDGSTLPYLDVTRGGTYWVEVVADGCVARDSIQVTYRDCTPSLRMPNVITPNGDGLNDTFKPIDMRNIVQMRTVVFNRWGNEVYQTEELLVEWNGRDKKGTPALTGTYFWLVQYVDSSGQNHMARGYVTILR